MQDPPARSRDLSPLGAHRAPGSQGGSSMQPCETEALPGQATHGRSQGP